MSASRTTGLETLDGNAVGRDPRTLSVDELQQLGHARMSPLKALRLRCVDCCAGSAHEVRLCVSVTCPSWPFRMGSNPWRPPISPATRERLATNAARIAAARSAAHKTGCFSQTEVSAAPTLAADVHATKTIQNTGGENR